MTVKIEVSFGVINKNEEDVGYMIYRFDNEIMTSPPLYSKEAARFALVATRDELNMTDADIAPLMDKIDNCSLVEDAGEKDFEVSEQIKKDKRKRERKSIVFYAVMPKMTH